MKNKKPIFAILGLLGAGVLAYFLTQDPKPPPIKHQITLVCKTIPNSKNFNDICRFGQGDSIPNQKYTVRAAVKDTVEWVGKLKNSNEGRIAIIEIIFESGTNIFDNKNIKGKKGIVNAIVKKGDKGDTLKYGLKFTVYNSQGTFVITDTIDPRIRIISR